MPGVPIHEYAVNNLFDLTEATKSADGARAISIPIGAVVDLNGGVVTIPPHCSVTGPGSLSNGEVRIADGATDITIMGVVFDDCPLRLSGSDINVISSTFKNINRNVLGAIFWGGSLSDALIKGNKIHDISPISSPNVYGCGIKAEIQSAQLRKVVIRENELYNIYGPAAIWLGGETIDWKNVEVAENDIYDTASFGIELYHTGANSSKHINSDLIISGNKISDTGSIRTDATGSGCGGIYSSILDSALDRNQIKVYANDIRRITEVGIEGSYQEVAYNYVEDTGCDQIRRPIPDNSGIFGGRNVHHNTIVNPGSNGGYYYYTAGTASRQINNNTVKNVFVKWSPGTSYAAGQYVVANEGWYKCVSGGVSGATAPNGVSASISDGSVVWEFRKFLCKIGISINAVSGCANTTIDDNTVIDIPYCVITGPLLSDVSIRRNTHICANIGKLPQYSGYGKRSGTNISIESPEYYEPSGNPEYGTYFVGDRLKLDPIAGGYTGKVCTERGTYKTINGVTGTALDGSVSIIFNDTSSIAIGDIISVGGVGRHAIIAIKGVSVTVDSPTSGIATDAVVACVPPVFAGFGLLV